MKFNAAINVTVLMDGYHGDHKSAIDECYELSKRLNFPVRLTYANQIVFHILPDMSSDDILKLKEKKFIIGL